ncbi:hypothetical protein PsorP6_004204 [Peronosclerospora sorghi]|uniref:Uncharacterized protein n=1 Tax=Peronosclerospora sorghi TaxID=230839 RepID=A0ACC0VM38_9STRA|nr:hypothetical protein PsorP6_004204 [Peronosclerospora sorghi]
MFDSEEGDRVYDDEMEDTNVFQTQSAEAKPLDIDEKRKPLGASMWEDVAYEYNRNLPSGHEVRDVEALRRKFTTMKNCKNPTGDPRMPPEVRRAKRIFREIESDMSVVELDDDARQSENFLTSALERAHEVAQCPKNHVRFQAQLHCVCDQIRTKKSRSGLVAAVNAILIRSVSPWTTFAVCAVDQHSSACNIRCCPAFVSVVAAKIRP